MGSQHEYEVCTAVVFLIVSAQLHLASLLAYTFEERMRRVDGEHVENGVLSCAAHSLIDSKECEGMGVDFMGVGF